MNNNQKLLDVLRAMKHSANHYALIGNKSFHDSEKVKNKTIMTDVYINLTLKNYFIDSFSKQNSAHEYIENAIEYKKSYRNKILKSSFFISFFAFSALAGVGMGEILIRLLFTLFRGDTFSLKNLLYIAPILIMFYMIRHMRFFTDFNFYKIKNYKKKTQKYNENFKNIIKNLLHDIEIYKINSDVNQDKDLIEEAEFLENYILNLQNDDKKKTTLFHEIVEEMDKEINYNYFNTRFSNIKNTLKDKKLNR